MSNDSRITEVKSVQREPGQGRRFISFKATQIILLISGILEVLIALRILLKLIGADPSSPIAALIYGFTNLLLFPFAGLIAPLVVAGNMVLEISSMVAIVVYALIGVVFEKLIWVIFSRPQAASIAITQTTTSDHHTPHSIEPDIRAT